MRQASDAITVGRLAVSEQLIQDSYARRWGDLMVGSEHLRIPYRQYDAVPGPVVRGSTVLAAWMTRSHDGRIRQEALEALLAADSTPWQPAYVVQPAGEYVIEICDVVAEYVTEVLPYDDEARGAYRSFVVANPDFIALTRARAASYWRAYSWRRCAWNAYPGRTALDALERLVRDCRKSVDLSEP